MGVTSEHPHTSTAIPLARFRPHTLADRTWESPTCSMITLLAACTFGIAADYAWRVRPQSPATAASPPANASVSTEDRRPSTLLPHIQTSPPRVPWNPGLSHSRCSHGCTCLEIHRDGSQSVGSDSSTVVVFAIGGGCSYIPHRFK